MKEKGFYSSVAAVMAIALLGITLATVQTQQPLTAATTKAEDVKAVWLNALALVQDQLDEATCVNAGPVDTQTTLGLLKQETGVDCTAEPREIPATNGEAAFKLSCERSGENFRAAYARSVALKIGGC